MTHVVLKPFGWCPDGYTREALRVGDERDFGSAASGLEAEGFIAAMKTDSAPGPSASNPAEEATDDVAGDGDGANDAADNAGGGKKARPRRRVR